MSEDQASAFSSTKEKQSAGLRSQRESIWWNTFPAIRLFFLRQFPILSKSECTDFASFLRSNFALPRRGVSFFVNLISPKIRKRMQKICKKKK